MKYEVTHLTDRKYSHPSYVIDVGLEGLTPESYLLEIHTPDEIYYNCLRFTDPYISKDNFDTLLRMAQDSVFYYDSLGEKLCEVFDLPIQEVK